MKHQIKQLYLRFKYRKQLKAGFKLLDTSKKINFTIVNGRAFLVNSQDPMVKVDLNTGKAEAYVAPEDTYKINVYYPSNDKTNKD